MNLRALALHIHLTMPEWLYLQPWMVVALLMTSVLFVLLVWSRWHWRMRLSQDLITYRIAFSHHSEDLPLRSEQLGNLLHNTKLPRRIRLFIGQPHTTFTYAAHGERVLYVTVPAFRQFPDKVRDALIDKLRGASLIPSTSLSPQRRRRVATEE
jgi:hypothetical protein